MRGFILIFLCLIGSKAFSASQSTFAVNYTFISNGDVIGADKIENIGTYLVDQKVTFSSNDKAWSYYSGGFGEIIQKNVFNHVCLAELNRLNKVLVEFSRVEKYSYKGEVKISVRSNDSSKPKESCRIEVYVTGINGNTVEKTKVAIVRTDNTTVEEEKAELRKKLEAIRHSQLLSSITPSSNSCGCEAIN